MPILAGDALEPDREVERRNRGCRSRQRRVSQHLLLHARVFCRSRHVSASLRQPKAAGAGKDNDRGGGHIDCRNGLHVWIFLAIELYPCVPASHGFDPSDVSPRVRFVAVSPAKRVEKNGSKQQQTRCIRHNYLTLKCAVKDASCDAGLL
jgi:hypothetical protein